MKTSAYCTVLVVDDSPEDRELYADYLRRAKHCTYTVLGAENAKQGLETCRRVRVDCILLDYNMPDRSGLDFLQLLRHEFGPASPPVVMITGRGGEHVAVTAMKAGASDYLVKDDVSETSLYEVTQAAVERLRAASEAALRAQRLLDEQRELRAKEARYRALLDSVRTYAIIMLDEDARVASWNAGARELFNLHEHEVLGHRADQLFADLDGPTALAATQLAKSSGHDAYACTRRMTCATKSAFWARCVLSSLPDDGSGTAGFSLVVRKTDPPDTRPGDAAELLKHLGPGSEAPGGGRAVDRPRTR